MRAQNSRWVNLTDFYFGTLGNAELGISIKLFWLGSPVSLNARLSASPETPLFFDSSVSTCGVVREVPVSVSRYGQNFGRNPHLFLTFYQRRTSANYLNSLPN
jgi:hypothetical protein